MSSKKYDDCLVEVLPRTKIPMDELKKAEEGHYTILPLLNQLPRLSPGAFILYAYYCNAGQLEPIWTSALVAKRVIAERLGFKPTGKVFKAHEELERSGLITVEVSSHEGQELLKVTLNDSWWDDREANERRCRS